MFAELHHSLQLNSTERRKIEINEDKYIIVYKMSQKRNTNILGGDRRMKIKFSLLYRGKRSRFNMKNSLSTRNDNLPGFLL